MATSARDTRSRVTTPMPAPLNPLPAARERPGVSIARGAPNGTVRTNGSAVGTLGVTRTWRTRSPRSSARGTPANAEVILVRVRAVLLGDTVDRRVSSRGGDGRTSTTGARGDTPDQSVCEFAEVGSRPYAESRSTRPVGYVETWYVDYDGRRQGSTAALC